MRSAEDPPDEKPTIGKLLRAQSAEDKVLLLMQLLERFGTWEPRGGVASAMGAVTRAAEGSGDRTVVARRVVRALADTGDVHGPAEQVVLGLFSAHSRDLRGIRHQLQRLVEREDLLLAPGGESESLVPLFVWALTSHDNAVRAGAALADALIDHPHVDDLLCDDEALLALSR